MLSSLSVFLPCYNEVDNIPKLIAQTYRIVPTLAKKFEIIIIDDGSSDQTVAVAREVQKKCPELRIVSHRKNRGYGAALRTGVSSARLEWIFWMDGDLQFSINSLRDFLPFTVDFDAIIGYRAHRADTLLRKINGELYTRMINLLFHMDVKDIDCAFKLIRRDRIQSIELETSSAFTSAEILIKLQDQGIKIKQLPVQHFPRKHGTPSGGSPTVIIKGLGQAMSFFLRSVLLRV